MRITLERLPDGSFINCGRMCDSDPKLNYREQYERSTVYVDNLLKQALNATETSTKETEE